MSPTAYSLTLWAYFLHFVVCFTTVIKRTSALTGARDLNHRQATQPVRECTNIAAEIMPGIRLSSDLRRQLEAVATPSLKRKGSILFQAGRPARGAFLIHSGRVKMTLAGSTNLYPARIVGSGSVIGLPATFSGEAYSLTAQVAEDCRLDFIPRRKLLNLLRRNPEAGFQIVRILSEEILQMQKAAGIKSPR